MKKFACIFFITVAAFFLTIAVAFADDAPITITANVNCSQCSVGDTVTVSFDVQGGSRPYQSVNVLWQECPLESDTLSAVAFHEMGSSSIGVCSFAPEYEGRLSITIHVKDALGRQEYTYAPEVAVSGGEYNSPILINVASDKSTSQVGEPINIVYSVSGGSGDYSSLTMMWEETATGCNAETTIAYVSLDAAQGAYSFSPPFSGELYVYVLATDRLGRTSFSYAPQIIISPEPGEEPVSILVDVDKTRIRVGEPVTVSYCVSGGSGIYSGVNTLWYEYATGSTTESSVAFSQGSEPIGSYTFSPAFTGKLSVTVHVTDSKGRKSYVYAPEILVPSINELEVEIQPLDADLVLPEELTGIEAESFLETGFTCIQCPSKLESIGSKAFANCRNLKQIIILGERTTIASDAFDGCGRITIICKINSDAYKYAREHMMDYCLID